MNEKELFRLKDQIDQAVADENKLKGRLAYLMQELKNSWDCASLTEAEEKVASLESEIEELEKDIQKSLNEIEGKP